MEMMVAHNDMLGVKMELREPSQFQGTCIIFKHLTQHNVQYMLLGSYNPLFLLQVP